MNGNNEEMKVLDFTDNDERDNNGNNDNNNNRNEVTGKNDNEMKFRDLAMNHIVTHMDEFEDGK